MKKLLYLCLMTCSSIVLADETAPIELKHKSSFNVEANERNPFWPIGWKPAPKITKTGAEHAGPAIPPSPFSSSPFRPDPRQHYGILNARRLAEGRNFARHWGLRINKFTVKVTPTGPSSFFGTLQE